MTTQLSDPTDAPATNVDTLAVLYPVDADTKERNDRHPGKTLYPDGTKLAFDLRGSVFFSGETRSWATPEEMYAALADLVAEGKCFVCRAHLGHDGAFLRRIKDPKGRCPPGVKRARLRTLVLDLDGWPNVLGHDPRVDAAATWRWILGVLGSEFAGVKMVAQWSSSCCFGVATGQAPAKLDGRLWLLMDRALGERSTMDLLKRLDLRVRAVYAEHGITMPKMGNNQVKKLVDPKVGDAIQPIYIAAPKMMDGMADPLAGTPRLTMLDGGHDTVRAEDLWANLPTLSEARQARNVEDEAAGKRVEPRMPKSRSKTVHVPGQPIAMGAARLEIEAIRKLAAAKGATAILEGCTNVYSLRVALEQVALAVHRGGIQEGERDHRATTIASALVAGMPLHRDVEWVRAQVRPLLVMACGESWVAGEWEPSGADAAIVANYVRAGLGELGRRGRKDPRYAYGKARLIDELQPSREEIRELRLRSLCSEADRAWLERELEREGCGRRAYDETILESRRLAPRVHALRQTGMAWRAIAEAVGRPVTSVQRLGALRTDEVAEVVAYLEREQAAEIAEAFELADAGTDANQASQYLRAPDQVVGELAAQGIEDVSEIVWRTGLPTQVVEDILTAFGVIDERMVA